MRFRRRRVPAVTQVTTTECGLCAAIALLSYHGRDETIYEVRKEIDAGRDGVRLTELASYLELRGMQVKKFRAKSIDALIDFESPLILFWDNGHFVVLENFDGVNARIMDPAAGRRRISRSELEEKFVGPAIWAYPGENFERRRMSPLAEWRQTKFLSNANRIKVLLVAALSLASYASILGLPMMTQWAIDRRADFRGLGDVAAAGILVAAIGIGYFAITWSRAKVLALLIEELGAGMMRNTFAKMLRLPYRFFSIRQPGELMFRLNSVNAIRDVLSTRIAQGLLDIGTFSVVSIYLFVHEWRVALVALALVVINGCIVVGTRDRLMEFVDEEISQISKSQTMQLDAMVSIPSIRLGGYEDELIQRWDAVFAKALSAMKRRMVLQEGVVGSFAGVSSIFGPLLLLILSLFFVSQGTMTLGAAIAVQMISATYFGIADSIFGMYTEFAESSRYLARINEILLSEPESTGGPRIELPDASLQLTNVSFRYSKTSPEVLTDINLDVGPGERVAIVGMSGSGKSTLAQLITSLYQPTEGSLFYGGIPAAQYNQKSLRSTIGFVPQETHMHNHSILENLTLGRDIELSEVAELCSKIGLLQTIQELPMGFHTIVSEMGANFSGGQRQRFAIARTLLQRPKILILDEATASLDTVNERIITEYLRTSGTTQIVIAHRLATVRDADRILVMERGRIVEQGTHDELIAQGAHYARIYEADETRTALTN